MTQLNDVLVGVPVGQKNPGGHTAAVALLEPAGHQKPSAHTSVHVSAVITLAFPNRPARQGEHVELPSALNVPGGHGTAVALSEPASHAKPAAHGPEHAELVAPLTLPKRPPGQSTHTAAAASE